MIGATSTVTIDLSSHRQSMRTQTTSNAARYKHCVIACKLLPPRAPDEKVCARLRLSQIYVVGTQATL